MVQGLTQAIGSFLSPAQMGTQFAELQKKVLAKPAKYIDSYQVFSEEQTGGMFRVAGQVTVSIGALKEDLEKSGILAVQQKALAQPAPSPGISVPTGATGSENAQVEEDVESAEEPDESQTSASAPQASQPPVIEEKAGRPSYRGMPPQRGKSCGQLRRNGIRNGISRQRAIMLVLFLREVLARRWTRLLDPFSTTRFCQDGSLRQYPPLSGDIGRRGAWHTGCGGRQGFLLTRTATASRCCSTPSLRVIRIGQGKSEFELHKAQSMEDLSNQEGALELARRIAPQLVTLLGGAQAGTRGGRRFDSRGGHPRPRWQVSARS